ncbi:hypothetical protein IJ380_01300 [Candidatus Saccharibacteria bacterium]|nr:hypothetical protein [Candidatus Saccharibacteria bacterium]
MYYIADLLTTTRLILIFVLAHLTHVHAPLSTVFIVYGAGQITDALDGFFAKKFPYPEDGKFRFWRVGKFPKIFDTGTDLILSLTFAAYFYLYVSREFVLVVIPSAVILGFFVEYLIRTPEFKNSPEATLKLIDTRRLLYGVSLFVVLARTILSLPLQIDAKYILELILGIVGVVVLIFKGNRLKEK